MVAIHLLTATHRRDGFDCGDVALNEFLLRQSGQLQRRGFGKTFVATAEDGVSVIGFVTASAGQIATSSLPDQAKLPRYPAPILRIGRLAVDIRHQGSGIGQDLLAFTTSRPVCRGSGCQAREGKIVLSETGIYCLHGQSAVPVPAHRHA
jgi:ribosomal protein S18 acetylase RimI-like enzyme